MAGQEIIADLGIKMGIIDYERLIANLDNAMDRVEGLEDTVQKMEKKSTPQLKETGKGLLDLGKIFTAVFGAMYALTVLRSPAFKAYFASLFAGLSYLGYLILQQLSPFINMLSKFVWGLARSFRELPDPIKKWISIFIAGVVLLKGPLTWLWGAISKLTEMLGAGILGSKLAMLGRAFGWIASVVGVVIGVFEIFTNWGKDTVGVLGGLIAAFAGLAGIIIMVATPVGWIGALIGGVVTLVVIFRKQIAEFFLGLANFIDNIAAKLESKLGFIGKLMGFAIKGIATAMPFTGYGAVKGIEAFGGGGTKGYQSGGYVSETGLAMVHRGERVIPSSGGDNNSRNMTFSPTVNVSVGGEGSGYSLGASAGDAVTNALRYNFLSYMNTLRY